jgi:hypothetical protein
MMNTDQERDKTTTAAGTVTVVAGNPDQPQRAMAAE